MTASSYAIGLFAMLVSASLAAQPSTGRDGAAAQALFEEGKQLVGQGKPEQACPKFEESQRLDPGVGTLFKLADCYERTGRFASAYAKFMDVAATTKQLGQPEREAVARERAEQLKPRLNRLTIVTDRGALPPGLTIERNGAPIGDAQWGIAIPVDPGTIVVRATAPGHVAWETRIEIQGEGRAETIDVPPLEISSKTAARGRAAEKPALAGPAYFDSEVHVAGAGVAGVGLVLLGVGTYFGVTAMSKQDESDPFCDGSRCKPEGIQTRQEAVSAGTYATASFAGATLCLAAGATLLLWNVDSSRRETGVTSLTLVPTPGDEKVASGALARVSGRF